MGAFRGWERPHPLNRINLGYLVANRLPTPRSSVYSLWSRRRESYRQVPQRRYVRLKPDATYRPGMA